jgi:transketolase
MSSGSPLSEFLRAKANQLRIDSIRATSAAGSGHPTTCLSAAEIMSVLFFKVMRYDPQDPQSPVNDRFVLSKGHGAPVLYSAWAEVGLFDREKLLTLRQIDSDLEGHPTPRLPFVDVATGSLGQGLSVGVGLALNSKFLDKSDYRTYVLMGDGEAAEGSIWEAAELASHYKLNNLVAILDANRLGQSQPTMLEHHTEIYRARFESFGFHAVAVDGHDVDALLEAFDQANQEKERPFAIIACTLKGKGVSFAEDKNGWHGKPFKKGEEEEKALAEVRAAGVKANGSPQIEKPSAAVPQIPAIRQMAPPNYKLGDAIATREAYGEALVKLGAANPLIVALDGDTKNSTYSEKFMKAYPDRFFECFIAEQNMVSIAAGLSARGKIPFASSFAVFISRGFDQVRMAGISHSHLKLCGSHVGVSIGEDGPSQMGLEDLALYRTIPNCVVFYPSDAVSTEHAVQLAAAHQGMAYIRTSRPKTKVIYRNDEEFEIGKAHVVRKGTSDILTIVTGGVTLFEALEAAEQLQKEGISVRIIDIFTVKPVDAETIISNANDTGKTVVTIEDHYPEGGIGESVLSALAETDIRVTKIAVSGVPRSGKPEELLAMYGIDAAGIAKRVREISSRTA